MWVSPFGNPRIEAYLQLPEAYRSLSRPSSAPDAKAFALCSYSLELPTYIVCSLNCLSFFVNKIIFFRIKKVFLFVSLCFPPFGEIVINFVRQNQIIVTQFFGKTQSLKIVSSLSVRFFNSFKSKYLNFFFYLFDCQVSFASSLCRLSFPSPS